ncbi:MAG: hypothetical protein HRK26_03965 [Rickettsiaceae bacterium H1]|nr:hypothetical protein [Rickettsiaceae bacterium H1]
MPQYPDKDRLNEDKDRLNEIKKGGQKLATKAMKRVKQAFGTQVKETAKSVTDQSQQRSQIIGDEEVKAAKKLLNQITNLLIQLPQYEASSPTSESELTPDNPAKIANDIRKNKDKLQKLLNNYEEKDLKIVEFSKLIGQHEKLTENDEISLLLNQEVNNALSALRSIKEKISQALQQANDDYQKLQKLANDRQQKDLLSQLEERVQALSNTAKQAIEGVKQVDLRRLFGAKEKSVADQLYQELQITGEKVKAAKELLCEITKLLTKLPEYKAENDWIIELTPDNPAKIANDIRKNKDKLQKLLNNYEEKDLKIVEFSKLIGQHEKLTENDEISLLLNQEVNNALSALRSIKEKISQALQQANDDYQKLQKLANDRQQKDLLSQLEERVQALSNTAKQAIEGVKQVDLRRLFGAKEKSVADQLYQELQITGEKVKAAKELLCEITKLLTKLPEYKAENDWIIESTPDNPVEIINDTHKNNKKLQKLFNDYEKNNLTVIELCKSTKRYEKLTEDEKISLNQKLSDTLSALKGVKEEISQALQQANDNYQKLQTLVNKETGRTIEDLLEEIQKACDQLQTNNPSAESSTSHQNTLYQEHTCDQLQTNNPSAESSTPHQNILSQEQIQANILPQTDEKLAQVGKEVSKVEELAKDAVRKVLERDIRLSNVQQKIEGLERDAAVFSSRSKQLKLNNKFDYYRKKAAICTGVSCVASATITISLISYSVTNSSFLISEGIFFGMSIVLFSITALFINYSKVKSLINNAKAINNNLNDLSY